MQPAFFPIIYIVAFVAVVLAIQALAGLLFSSLERTRRVNRRLTMLQSGMKPDDVYAALVRRTPTGNIQNKRLLDLYETLWTYCRQAGLTLTPMRLFLIVAAATGVLWLFSMALLKTSQGAGFAVDAVLRLIGAAILSVGGTWVWINGQRTRRLKKLEEQLPLALDVVVRAIRAGHPVVSAVQLAADELGDPLGSEFGLIVDEYTYGSDFKDALTGFARRTGSPDAHFFAVSVGIQAETGGNLAEILDGSGVGDPGAPHARQEGHGAGQRRQGVRLCAERPANLPDRVADADAADLLHRRNGFDPLFSHDRRPWCWCSISSDG